MILMKKYHKNYLYFPKQRPPPPSINYLQFATEKWVHIYRLEIFWYHHCRTTSVDNRYIKIDFNNHIRLNKIKL